MGLRYILISRNKGQLALTLIQASRTHRLASRHCGSIFSVWGLQKNTSDFLRNFHPSSTPPLILGPQEYFKGNSIHMCLIRVHLTHWHVVFQELIDVQGVFWPFFLNLAELPFFELENCLLLGVSSTFESWKFWAQLETSFPNLYGILGLTNVASVPLYKALSCLIFFSCVTPVAREKKSTKMMITFRASKQVPLEVTASLRWYKMSKSICSLQPPFTCLHFFYVVPTQRTFSAKCLVCHKGSSWLWTPLWFC